jgi:serine-type D-Ala-D-Ala carboxypeptidase/endopeptidase (penicillin-binding protein 4)
MPPLEGLRLPESVPLTNGGCGDWRTRLRADFSEPMAPVFRGGFPAACGERQWSLSLLGHEQYFAAAFRALWRNSGGVWRGVVRDATVPPEARRVALQESAPLAELIRDINKFSNNVMTRQLFLTLGAQAPGSPASIERARLAIDDWLSSRGLRFPELVLENGSGLSRSERISAGSLAALLRQAWSAPLMPEFVASLPLAGVDGTMRRRTAAAGQAHIKTGALADVRAIAGFVHAASGRRYVVVGIVNHAEARKGTAVLDSLLQWLQSAG